MFPDTLTAPSVLYHNRIQVPRQRGWLLVSAASKDYNPRENIQVRPRVRLLAISFQPRSTTLAHVMLEGLPHVLRRPAGTSNRLLACSAPVYIKDVGHHNEK